MSLVLRIDSFAQKPKKNMLPPLIEEIEKAHHDETVKEE